MSRPVLEVADIFRSRGPAWRRANAGHVSLGQLKVMSAIESCRTRGRSAAGAVLSCGVHLPATVADIAYQNKSVIYDLLFKASAETLITIAADPKHLGARVGITSVLHSWGSAMTHHPHVHMIVPGGGISLDGERWVACRPRLLPPRPRALPPVPPAVPGDADGGTQRR